MLLWKLNVLIKINNIDWYRINIQLNHSEPFFVHRWTTYDKEHSNNLENVAKRLLDVEIIFCHT